MSSVFWSHLVALTWAAICYSGLWIVLSPVVPQRQLMISHTVWSVLLLSWLIALIIRARTASPGHVVLREWAGFTQVVYLGGNSAVLISYFLVMPYTNDAIRLAGLLLCTGPFFLQILDDGRYDPDAPRGWFCAFRPFLLPVGLFAYFLVYWNSYSPLIMIFLPLLCVRLFAVRRMVEQSVQRTRASEISLTAQREAKIRFLSSASHDIMQPLLSARLFMDQALRARQGDHRKLAVAGAEDAFSSMERQLHRMLDYLKLDGEERPLTLCALPTLPVLARMTVLADARAQKRGISIRLASTSYSVLADEDYLERAISNLIDNAIHHSDCTAILVGARRKGNRVRLWVIDNGRGIPVSEQVHIFDDFFQGADPERRRLGGFGLGLASVQRMMALMKGRAGLDPRWRRGSAFFLELPAE